MASRPERLLRGSDSPLSASFLELFFDLAFVLALSQLAGHLLHDLTLAGALRTAVLLTGVWWIWVTTTWFADWYDPESPSVRWLLVVAALGSLLAGVAIPQALDGRGLLFAGAYVSVHIARGMVTAVRAARSPAAEAGAAHPLLVQRLRRTVAGRWVSAGVAGAALAARPRPRPHRPTTRLAHAGDGPDQAGRSCTWQVSTSPSGTSRS